MLNTEDQVGDHNHEAKSILQKLQQIYEVQFNASFKSQKNNSVCMQEVKKINFELFECQKQTRLENHQTFIWLIYI